MKPQRYMGRSVENGNNPVPQFFDDSTMEIYRFQGLVNKSLILWRGINLLKFKINFHKINQSLVRDMDVWMSFAKKAEEIYLHMSLHYIIHFHYQRLLLKDIISH